MLPDCPLEQNPVSFVHIPTHGVGAIMYVSCCFHRGVSRTDLLTLACFLPKKQKPEIVDQTATYVPRIEAFGSPPLRRRVKLPLRCRLRQRALLVAKSPYGEVRGWRKVGDTLSEMIFFCWSK